MRSAVFVPLLLALSVSGNLVRAAERAPVLAVFEIQDTTKRPKATVEKLTGYLRVKLAESGTFRIVDKGEQEAQLRKFVAEQKKESYKPCYDNACQIPLGKELAADRILRAKLDRIGKTFILSAEIIDLVTGASTGGASDKSDGSDDGLVASVERLAGSLSAAKVAKETAPSTPDAGSAEASLPPSRPSEKTEPARTAEEPGERKPIPPTPDATRARALTAHGTQLLDAGSTDEAIAEYKAAIASEPTFPVARLKLGDALQKKGDLAGALAAYEYYAALLPNDGEGFLRRGEVQVKLGNRENAKSSFDRALKIADANRDRDLLSRVTSAIEALKTTAAVEPEKTPDVLATEAYVHGDYAGAIEQAKKALPTAPIKAWRIIGASSCFLKDRDGAIRAWNQLPSTDRQFIKYVCSRNALQIP